VDGMKKIIAILLGILVLFVTGGFSTWKLPNADIEGMVTYWEGISGVVQPDIDTEIYVFNRDRLVVQTLVNEAGKYRTAKISPGDYTVYIVSGSARRNVLIEDETVSILAEKLRRYPANDTVRLSDAAGYAVKEIHIELEPFKTETLNWDF
jgi:hypothetical protein